MKKAASIFGLGLLNALGCGLAVAGAPAPRPGPPNVVMIFVDDLGYGDVGVAGQNARFTNGLPAIGEATNVTAANSAIVAQMENLLNTSDTAPWIPASVVLAVNPARALDFGALPVGKPPVTLTFSVSNAATGCASLMSGTVSASVTDPRLSAQISGYGPLVAGGTSATFSVTFNPSSFAPLTNQSLGITMTTGLLEFELVTLATGKTN